MGLRKKKKAASPPPPSGPIQLTQKAGAPVNEDPNTQHIRLLKEHRDRLKARGKDTGKLDDEIKRFEQEHATSNGARRRGSRTNAGTGGQAHGGAYGDRVAEDLKKHGTPEYSAVKHQEGALFGRYGGYIGGIYGIAAAAKFGEHQTKVTQKKYGSQTFYYRTRAGKRERVKMGKRTASGAVLTGAGAGYALNQGIQTKVKDSSKMNKRQPSVRPSMRAGQPPKYIGMDTRIIKAGGHKERGAIGAAVAGYGIYKEEKAVHESRENAKRRYKKYGKDGAPTTTVTTTKVAATGEKSVSTRRVPVEDGKPITTRVRLTNKEYGIPKQPKKGKRK